MKVCGITDNFLNLLPNVRRHFAFSQFFISPRKYLKVRESLRQDYSLIFAMSAIGLSRTFVQFRGLSMNYADSKKSARVSRTFEESFTPRMSAIGLSVIRIGSGKTSKNC